MKRTICALHGAGAVLRARRRGRSPSSRRASFSDYAYFEDDSARVIDADGDYREGLFDIEGSQVIPCEYEALSGYGATGYYVAQREDGLNVRGALDAAGNEVIPFQYGDIRFLSERWALGVTLEETQHHAPATMRTTSTARTTTPSPTTSTTSPARGYVGFFSYQ